MKSKGHTVIFGCVGEDNAYRKSVFYWNSVVLIYEREFLELR